MRPAARTWPTPKSRSMSRRVRNCRSSCSSWLMASGMARSHRGFAGIVKSSRAGDQAGRRRRRRRERPRPGCRVGEDLHARPSGRDDGGFDVGAGDGRAGSGPAGGLRLDAGGGARPRRPRRPRRRRRGPGGGGARRGASTSAVRPPDPAGAAAAEAGVPGAKNLRSAGLEAARRPGRVPLRSRVRGHSPAGPLPIGGQPAVGVEVGTKRRRGAQAVTPPRSSCARP